MAPLAVESSFYLRPSSGDAESSTAAAAASGSQDRPEVIHLRLSHDVLLQLSQGQAGSVGIDLSASKPALVVDGTSHALQRVDETSPHELYRLSHSGPRAKPSTLTHVGAISTKLSLRQTLASSGTAASRLKERRGEEEARREANRAVLLDEVASISLRSKSAARLPKRPEAGPAAKLRDSLGKSAARSASLQPRGALGAGTSEAGSRASTPGGAGLSQPGTPKLLTTALTPRLGSSTLPSVSVKPPSGTPLSTRLRLIHLLAQGPLARRKIVASLKSPEPSIIKLLSNHAHAPPELQPDASKASKKFKGPVNRRSAPAAPLRSPTVSGPGTVYALLDQVYADVRLDWPAYDARSRVEVSELAEAAFERMHLPLDAPERAKLFPDGRPTPEQREAWRKERLVERMDDGEELSEAEEEEEVLKESYEDDAMHVEELDAERGRTIERTASPLKGLGLSGAAQSGSGSGSASRSSVESRSNEPSAAAAASDDESALKPGTRAAVKKKSSSAIERIKKAVKGKGPSPAQRAKEIEKARKDKEREQEELARGWGKPARSARSSVSAAPAKEAQSAADLPEPKRASRKVSISDSAAKSSAAKETTSQAAAPAPKRTRRQSTDTATEDAPQQVKSALAPAPRRSAVRSREYTDTESDSDSVSASATRRPSSGKPSAFSRARRTSRPDVSSSEKPRHGVGLGATRAAEPWLDVRSASDWAQLRERFLRVHAAYREAHAVVAAERRALHAELDAARIAADEARERPNRYVQALGAEQEEGEASPVEPEFRPMEVEGASFAWRSNGNGSGNAERAPLAWAELEGLVKRQIDMHGQLKRMKETLQSSKKIIEGA